MDKNLIVVFLVVIALLAVGFYFWKPPAVDNDTTSGTDGGTTTTSNLTAKEAFEAYLASSNEMFIVMDLRGTDNSTIRNNIMQCGVDVAGSVALGGKNKTIIAIEEDSCFVYNGTKTVEYCLSLITDTPTFYIATNKETEYSEKMVTVDIGATYNLYDCHITGTFQN